MKRIIFSVISIILCVACTREIDYRVGESGSVLYATLEQPADAETKAYADENLMILWHADDRISVFNHYTYNEEYRFTGETGDNAGSFSKVPYDDFTVGNDLPGVYAVYPYQASTRISNKGQLTVTLPSEQVYAEHSFGPGASTMVSSTVNNNLLFKSVGGFLVFKLYGAGASVSSVTLKGNNGERLAGKAMITAPFDGAPTLEMQADDSSQEVTLTCPTPVSLNASADAYKEFWVVLPPTTFSKGFTITITGPNGSTFEKSTTKSITVARNMLSRMAAIEVELDGGDVPPDNEIWYTTTDGKALEITWPSNASTRLLSNTYSNGKGVLVLDGEVDAVMRTVFSEKETLYEVYLPECADNLYDFCFAGCTNLVHAFIPATFSGGGYIKNPFMGCTRLSEIIGPNASTDSRSFVINGKLISLALEGLTEYSVPSEVISSISSFVFTDFRDKVIRIPKGTNIDDAAFGRYHFYNGIHSYDSPVNCRFVLEGAWNSFSAFRLFQLIWDGSEMEVEELTGYPEFLEEVYSLMDEIGYCCARISVDHENAQEYVDWINGLSEILIPSAHWASEEIIEDPEGFYRMLWDFVDYLVETFVGKYAILSVQLDRSRLELIEETVGQLSASATYRFDDVSLDLIWETSNPDVVRVNENGIVWATGPGTAEITVSSGSKFASCAVQVTAPNDLGPGWVDMGLSVKWGTANLGASWSGSRGLPIAWGETVSKSDFNIDSYKWFGNGDYNCLLKYNTLETYGDVDNLITLLPEDDAASVLLGAGWRTPTAEEYQELVDKCAWTWTERNGINGYIVTSKINGNSLFLPATTGTNGYHDYRDYGTFRTTGQYWSSSVVEDDPRHAHSPYLKSGYINIFNNRNLRNLGHYIRPVKD